MDNSLESFRAHVGSGAPLTGLDRDCLADLLDELAARRAATSSLVRTLRDRPARIIRATQAITIVGLFSPLFDFCVGERWTCNDPRACYPGQSWDRVFQIHRGRPSDPAWLAWLETQRAVVHPDDVRPGWEAYPTEDALALSGGNRAWLSSSVALMLAMALMRPGLNRIHLTGFSFLREGAHSYQLAAIQRWIERARVRGVRVTGPCVEAWRSEPLRPLVSTERIYGLETGWEPVEPVAYGACPSPAVMVEGDPWHFPVLPRKERTDG